MRIAVVTSGGDCPGMNACLFHIYKFSKLNRIDVLGVTGGFQGLVDNKIEPITDEFVENIYNVGGTVIKTGRSADFLTEKGMDRAISNIKKQKIDTLIIIGGNGSFNGANDLVKRGIACICIPGTIDNDLFYTDKSLGFDTAVNSAVDAIENIRRTMRSHNRGCVVEVMGRDCGAIALHSAVASGADIVVLKEDPLKLSDITKRVKKVIQRGSNSPLIIIAEKQFDPGYLAEALYKETKQEFKACVIGYIQRGGSPTVFDREYALMLSVKAVNAALLNQRDAAIGLRYNTLITIPIKEAIDTKPIFNKELYDYFNDLNKNH